MKLSCFDVLKEKNVNECNVSNLVLEYMRMNEKNHIITTLV